MTKNWSLELAGKSWWKDVDLRKEFKDLAKALLQHPNLKQSDIVSIGQSPAWLSVACEETLKRQNNRVLFVPHSGGNPPEAAIHIEGGRLVYGDTEDSYSRESPIPTTQYYRNFLTRIGVTPQKIIQRFRDDNVKTSFVDVVDSKSGLYQFMHVMSDWAKDEGCLEDFVACANVVPIKFRETTAAKVTFPDIGASYALTGINSEITGFLLSETHKKNRVVPYYPCGNWEKSPSVNINFTNALITSALKSLGKDIADEIEPLKGRNLG